MALIKCPECQNSISDKAAKCPHCGLPAEYFGTQSADSNKHNDIDYKSIANIIISFDKDYADITFMTAHSSKGLGYDNVILINMFEGKFGFPCQIEDDPIMKLVMHEDRSMPFAEERRLFYVAMTRTKNRVYIATPKHKPSRFLVELIKDYNLPHDEGINMHACGQCEDRSRREPRP